MSFVGKEEQFGDRIHGTIGRFASRTGEIHYLMAKARLGETGEINQERRLTEHLHPVRELLPVERLSFSQLLQRDLDDARVASELIPYLLRERGTGPAFFPPVTAMLLPFRDKVPDASFPAPDPATEIDDGGIVFQRVTYGSSFAVDVLLDGPGGEPAWPSLGRVLWSTERAKLVVLDGQHRAMALLAVFRTLNGIWENSEYRIFYQDAVQGLLDGLDRGFLSEVELPVTICWAADSPDPHGTARTLFVDLNQNARTPSPSRLLLLDDSRLLALFVRRVLDEVKRGEHSPLSLACIEYDSPEEARRGPLRWSALTNLEIIKSAVEKFLFGPEDVITTMAAKPIRAGRRNDSLMRVSLWLEDMLPTELDDNGRTFLREEIRDAHCPKALREQLSDRFWMTWGEPLALILGSVLPHQAHVTALEELRLRWIPDSAASALVFRAVFEGTGLYWSLAESDAVDTEQIERRWRRWFESKRAEHYLGTDDEATVAGANEALATFRLIACQLGLLLAYRTLAKKAGWRPEELVDGAHRFVGAINSSFVAGEVGHGRRLAMVRKPGSLNMLEKLDANDAPSFKYFWAELAALDESGHLADDAHTAITSLAAEGRSAYWDTLTRQRRKALQIVQPNLDDAEIAARARAAAALDLYRALKTALDLPDDIARDMMIRLPGLEEEMLEGRAAEEDELLVDDEVDELELDEGDIDVET